MAVCFIQNGISGFSSILFRLLSSFHFAIRSGIAFRLASMRCSFLILLSSFEGCLTSGLAICACGSLGNNCRYSGRPAICRICFNSFCVASGILASMAAPVLASTVFWKNVCGGGKTIICSSRSLGIDLGIREIREFIWELFLVSCTSISQWWIYISQWIWLVMVLAKKK